MGLESIELLNEKDWATVKSHGLKCAVGYATDWGIPKGFNRIENHDKLVADFEAMIPKAAEAGVPNLICFSGNREGSERPGGTHQLCQRAAQADSAIRKAWSDHYHGVAEQLWT